MTDDRRRERRVVVGSLVVIAAAVLIGAFFAGTRLGARADAAAPSAPPATPIKSPVAARPSPTPTPTKGPIAPGSHPWQALLGGECLDPYDSPWQATYAVVACSAPHAGQMTHRVHLKGRDYPGSAALVATLSLACAGAKSVDLAAAQRYDDLRIAYSYPTAAQWTAGDDHGYCFVSRAKGGRLERSVAP